MIWFHAEIPKIFILKLSGHPRSLDADFSIKKPLDIEVQKIFILKQSGHQTPSK